jgi:phage shock protein A
MGSIIDKLNALVRSNVQNVLERGKGSGGMSLGKDIDREITVLREQINTALDHEEALNSQITAAQQQIAAWDAQADRALLQGDEAAARRLIQQIQHEQRQIAFIEADLDKHRRATSELIEQVNELEAVVAAARQEQQQQAKDQAEDETTPSLSERLRTARQSITQEAAPSPSAPGSEVDDQAVDDDLAQRRARLSQ